MNTSDRLSSHGSLQDPVSSIRRRCAEMLKYFQDNTPDSADFKAIQANIQDIENSTEQLRMRVGYMKRGQERHRRRAERRAAAVKEAQQKASEFDDALAMTFDERQARLEPPNGDTLLRWLSMRGLISVDEQERRVSTGSRYRIKGGYVVHFKHNVVLRGREVDAWEALEPSLIPG